MHDIMQETQTRAQQAAQVQFLKCQLATHWTMCSLYRADFLRNLARRAAWWQEIRRQKPDIMGVFQI